MYSFSGRGIVWKVWMTRKGSNKFDQSRGIVARCRRQSAFQTRWCWKRESYWVIVKSTRQVHCIILVSSTNIWKTFTDSPWATFSFFSTLFHIFPSIFCPFPVLSLPFHFISIRVNPMCLDSFMHLVSWNLGWSLYFMGFMRWGDKTGTAHKGSLVRAHKSADWQLMGLMKAEKDSPELSARLEWGLWTGDGFTFLKTTERRMNGLETYFLLSGRKEIYYCLILLFKFCPKKFQEPL